jgi:frataxin-like iron-binding protein CyaY
MKNQTITATMIGVLIIVLAAPTAHAQGGSAFVVRIPFDFFVAGKTFPAGDYTFTRSTQSSNEGLKISNKRHGAFVQTKAIQALEILEETQVVFNRYGDRYFLSQVWLSARSTGRELFKSAQEQKFQRELSQRAAKAERVSILVQPR